MSILSSTRTGTPRSIGPSTLAATAGVPMILARDSRAISEHATGLGPIPSAALGVVRGEIASDHTRPETCEQALHDAVESLLPEDPKPRIAAVPRGEADFPLIEEPGPTSGADAEY